MPAKKLIIAIDGPAGSGKSTTAKYLAAKIGIPYIDSGAMYRATTWKIMQKGIGFTELKRMVGVAKKIKIRFVGKKVLADGRDVTKVIRTPELTKNVVHIAKQPQIRREMVKKQRALGKKEGAVMEGRDIGSVVFPKADYKFYFDADLPTRALRRWKDLQKAGKPMPLAQVKKEIQTRDKTDTERKAGALKVARGAQVLDTSGLTIPQTADKILRIIGLPR
jgi:CMP/dCMP kinase